MDEHVLHATAVIDIANADKTQWQATGIAGTPFHGLFAVGESFADARRAFAEIVAAAVTSGAIDVALDQDDIANLDAIRVLATTRKTFPIEQLKAGATT